MTVDISKLKKSTMAWVSFFILNITATQVQTLRDKVLPLLIHHPKVAGVVLSIFGIALALHRPEVQNLYKKLHDGTLVPLPPNAIVGASPTPVVATEETPKP